MHIRSLAIVMAAFAISPLSFAAAVAGSIQDPASLQSTLETLAANHPGRVGICVQDAASGPICVNGDQRFSLQSVMKVVVGTAVMRAVDEGRLKLSDPVLIRRDDLSVNIQPIADIVAAQGEFATTIGDLVARAVIESDSAATDVLIDRLGGVQAVQAWLDSAGLDGLRIDRTERTLQTETDGLEWQADFVFPERLEAARSMVSEQAKQAAFDAYLKDERDTATPRGMTEFLHSLATGELLSPVSTRHFLDVMSRTRTFPDRLRAGAPEGWTVGHKTGTSRTLGIVNGVTNDVGMMTAPDGGIIAIAAFVAESTASSMARAAVIADAACAVTSAYR